MNKEGTAFEKPFRKGQPVAREFSEASVIGDIQLGRTSSLRVSLLEAPDGRRLVDIRRWQSAEWYSGPTKKGVTIGVDKLEELLDLLREATVAA